MPTIDPSKNWIPLEQRLATETNPKFRSQIAEVMFHIRVEAEGDVERALERLSPHAQYVLYDNANPTVTLTGVDEIRTAFYHNLVAQCHENLQWSITRIVVDEGVVITEGDLKLATRGYVLAAAGLDADPDTFYLTEGRHLVIWPFDADGRLIGEQVYYGRTTPPEESVKHPLRLEEIGSVSGTAAPEPAIMLAL